ncbi:sulfotransferase [Magnetococcus sp. PR-3]|uniref:sulfotransferase n=1 Tax=Magnetococcus sp. PR-3 TaxID=3120355 RepID=UPI002FCE5F15
MNRAQRRKQKKLAKKKGGQSVDTTLLAPETPANPSPGKVRLEVKPLLERANTMIKSGEPQAAAKICTHVLESQPNQPVANHLMGLAYVQMGQAEAAVPHLQKAVHAAPEHAPLRQHLSVPLMQLGRLDEAQTQIEKAVELDPKQGSYQGNLCFLLKEAGALEEALAYGERGVALSPKDPGVHNNLALVLMSLDRLEHAEASFKKVLELAPSHVDALVSLSHLLKRRGRPGEAVKYGLKAAELDPTNSGAYNNLGSIFYDLGRLDEAELHLKQALQLNPDLAAAHNNMANVLRGAGHMEKAAQYYRQAITLNPDLGEAYHQLSRVHTFGAEDADLALMESRYADPSCGDENRMFLGYGLAKAYEDLKQYDRAWDAMTQANEIFQQRHPYHADVEARYFEMLKAGFGPWVEERPDDEEQAAPIFIVGMPRSGTTLVEQILASHPRVATAGESTALFQLLHHRSLFKPDEIFAQQASTLDEAALGQIRRVYLQAVARVAKEDGSTAHIIDKMPHNFRFIGMIRRLFPKAIVIHCRRDPMDTCLSIYKNYFSQGHGYGGNVQDLAHQYGLYADLMAHWRQLLPDFVHEIEYEALVADGETGIKQLLAMCDLPFDPVCLDFHNTQQPVLTASSVQVRQPIYQSSVGGWKRFEQQLQPLKERLHTLLA